MDETDITWRKILPEPFVLLELGARGEGKTALGHRLLEVFGQNGRDAYIMGFPESKADLLPEWVETLPPTTTMEDWPEDSIVLIHEAHHLLHARRSMDAENLEIDKLVTVSRHKNSDIVYDTQQSHRLDKNAVAAVDGICVRWPALMQEKFERRQVRPIIKDARDTLSKYVKVHDDNDFQFVERREDSENVDLLKKHVYVHADQFRGEYPHEIQLPEHWSEEISKAYGDLDADGSDSDGGGLSINSLSEIGNGMADLDDIEHRDAEEIMDMVRGSERAKEKLGVGGDEGGDGGGEELELESGSEDGDGDGDSDDDFLNPFTEDDKEQVPLNKDPFDVEGVTEERVENARRWLRQMEEAGNQVVQWRFGEEDPAVKIIVPSDIYPKVEYVSQEARTTMGKDRKYGMFDPAFAEEAGIHPASATAFHYILEDGDDFDSGPYDLTGIVNAIEADDEPFMLVYNQLVEDNAIPLDTTR